MVMKPPAAHCFLLDERLLQGVPSGRVPGLGRLRFGMFHPAWAVGSYSSRLAARQPGELPKSEST